MPEALLIKEPVEPPPPPAECEYIADAVDVDVDADVDFDVDVDVDFDADDDEYDDEVSLCNALDAVCFEVPYFSANKGHIILTAITTTPAINKLRTVFPVSFFIIRSTFLLSKTRFISPNQLPLLISIDYISLQI